MHFDMSISDIVMHQKSKNVIFCDESTVIRIGDIAANIITSAYINHIQGLQAPNYSLCTLCIDGHKIDACCSKDVYTDIVNLQCLTNFMPNDLQDVEDYVTVTSKLVEEYFSVDISTMLLHRTQLSYLLSSVIMPIDNIVLRKRGSKYVDDGIILGVSFGYNITENSNRNFLLKYSGKDELLQYFEGNPMLIIDYAGFKACVKEKLNCELYHNNDTFRLRCEYILRVIDMLMGRTKGVIWTTLDSV